MLGMTGPTDAIMMMRFIHPGIGTGRDDSIRLFERLKGSLPSHSVISSFGHMTPFDSLVYGSPSSDV